MGALIVKNVSILSKELKKNKKVPDPIELVSDPCQCMNYWYGISIVTNIRTSILAGIMLYGKSWVQSKISNFYKHVVMYRTTLVILKEKRKKEVRKGDIYCYVPIVRRYEAWSGIENWIGEESLKIERTQAGRGCSGVDCVNVN